MDHFAGVDRLLRLCLHRPEPLHLLGPEGFIGHVEHRLRSYVWNLLDEDSADFRLIVSECVEDRLAAGAEFRAREAFRRREAPAPELARGCVLQEDAFRVEVAILDHGIPCLAFCLRERLRVNVMRGSLERLAVQSRHLLERIEHEPMRLGGPAFADELVGCEALEGLQSPAEVVGRDEVSEVTAKLIVVVVVEALDCRVLDGSVHSLDLTVGPRVLRLCGAMFDPCFCAGEFEGVGRGRVLPLPELPGSPGAPSLQHPAS
jgi:hypothetical protein